MSQSYLLMVGFWNAS